MSEHYGDRSPLLFLHIRLFRKVYTNKKESILSMKEEGPLYNIYLCHITFVFVKISWLSIPAQSQNKQKYKKKNIWTTRKMNGLVIFHPSPVAVEPEHGSQQESKRSRHIYIQVMRLKRKERNHTGQLVWPATGSDKWWRNEVLCKRIHRAIHHCALEKEVGVPNHIGTQFFFLFYSWKGKERRHHSSFLNAWKKGSACVFTSFNHATSVPPFVPFFLSIHFFFF
jgi:hypothetical protein